MEWKVIKPDVFATIMDFFTTGLPVLNEEATPQADTGFRLIFPLCSRLSENTLNVQIPYI